MTELDRYMDDFGARLSGAKRPRRRRFFALGGAVALATAVVVALLLLVPSSKTRSVGPVDAIAAARKALDPTGVILHFRIRTEVPDSSHQVFYEETWSAQDPQRWRLTSWMLRGPKHDRRSHLSYGGGESRSFYGGKLVITTGYRDYTPQTRMPTIFSQTGNDPDADLRAQLVSGKFKDEGEQQVGGRTVRRLSRDDGVRKLVVDVDPQTFVPVGGTQSFRAPGKPLSSAMTSTFAVEAFERLPISAETVKRLTFTPPAGTRVVTRTAADIRRYQREHRKWRKTCKLVGKRHLLTCPTKEPKLRGS
jgi:hypothetical protein